MHLVRKQLIICSAPNENLLSKGQMSIIWQLSCHSRFDAVLLYEWMQMDHLVNLTCGLNFPFFSLDGWWKTTEDQLIFCISSSRTLWLLMTGCWKGLLHWSMMSYCSWSTAFLLWIWHSKIVTRAHYSSSSSPHFLFPSLFCTALKHFNVDCIFLKTVILSQQCTTISLVLELLSQVFKNRHGA